tara:strand:- start:121 stop:1533 length:1413 start_codon:yes stop_codon:yes gene_type:complete
MNTVQDVVIIGAGSAGLSAYKEASQFTKNILIIDQGPLGTTCARTGCMPSKVFIQAAQYFYQRHHYAEMGIEGQEQLHVNMQKVMSHVRSLRDYFTKGVVENTLAIGDSLKHGQARFIDKNTIEVNGERIQSKAFIIATGSTSHIPDSWQSFQKQLLISENFFEQESFPKKMGVIGAGSIGLELGQSLAFLGIDISMFHSSDMIAGLSDPKVNDVAIGIFKKSLKLHLHETVDLHRNGKHLEIKGSSSIPVEKVVVAIGRTPHLKTLNLEVLGLSFDGRGVPLYDKTTMKMDNASIFIAGDINADNALLHEAADEGRIAGYNATHDIRCFKRRTPIRMLFTKPNIAVVGQSYASLNQDEVVIGEVDFSNQGRARVMMENEGILRIYGHRQTGQILGAEMIAPSGEHIAHLLAWAIDRSLSVFDVLKMPFYHPTVEEGMRTALRALAKQVVQQTSEFELALCNSEAVESLT